MVYSDNKTEVLSANRFGERKYSLVGAAVGPTAETAA
jgi:hypothetical protein